LTTTRAPRERRRRGAKPRSSARFCVWNSAVFDGTGQHFTKKSDPLLVGPRSSLNLDLHRGPEGQLCRLRSMREPPPLGMDEAKIRCCPFVVEPPSRRARVQRSASPLPGRSWAERVFHASGQRLPLPLALESHASRPACPRSRYHRSWPHSRTAIGNARWPEPDSFVRV